jgi:hypothetical protein
MERKMEGKERGREGRRKGGIEKTFGEISLNYYSISFSILSKVEHILNMEANHCVLFSSP